MQRMVTHQDMGEGSHNRDEESDERRAIGTPPDLAETVKSLMVELQSCKANNERMMKEQEKKTEINAVLLQSLSDLQRKMQHELEIQKHGHISGHTERSTSRKVHPRGKGPVPDDSSEKEAGDSGGSWSSLLMQRKRLQRDFTREFLTIDHRQMTLHAL
jgi:hypothetical protein